MMILDVDEENGIVILPWIDAFDGTPVLDIKPFLPGHDSASDATVPDWVERATERRRARQAEE